MTSSRFRARPAFAAAAVIGSIAASLFAVQAVALPTQESGQDEQEATEAKAERWKRSWAEHLAELEAEIAQAGDKVSREHAERIAELAARLAEQKAAWAQERTEWAQEGVLKRAQMEKELAERLAQVRPRIEVRGPRFSFYRSGSSASRILASAEDLGLSDEQQERIRALDKDHRRAEIERDASIEVAELDLEDLLDDGDSADLNAVESKMMEIAALRVQARIADLRREREVESVLTQEQKDKLDDMAPHGMLFRRDGNSLHFEREGGDHEFSFLMPDDDVVFGLREALEPLEWIDHFDFDGSPWGVFKFHMKDDDQKDESDQEGTERSSAGSVSSSKKGVKTL